MCSHRERTLLEPCGAHARMTTPGFWLPFGHAKQANPRGGRARGNRRSESSDARRGHPHPCAMPGLRYVACVGAGAADHRGRRVGAGGAIRAGPIVAQGANPPTKLADPPRWVGRPYDRSCGGCAGARPAIPGIAGVGRHPAGPGSDWGRRVSAGHDAQHTRALMLAHPWRANRNAHLGRSPVAE
jgi:hypothetical protein